MLYFHRVLPFSGSLVLCAAKGQQNLLSSCLQNTTSVLMFTLMTFLVRKAKSRQMLSFRISSSFFDELRFEAAIEKDIPPTCEMLCLNIVINTISFTLFVLEFRIIELLGELDRWRTLQQMSKRNVQCSLGKLSYVAACVKPERPFMAALINSLAEFKSH